MELLEVVVQVEVGIEVAVSRQVEVAQQARTVRVAVAVTPKPPHITPLSVRESEGKMIFIAWNPGTPGPSARLASPLHQSRHQAEVRKARTTAVRLCVVLRSAFLVLTMTHVMRNVVIASVRSG